MGHTLDNAIWREAAYSGSNGGDCVESPACPGTAVAVRDSKDPDGPKLTFSRDEWRAFTTSVKRGELGLG